MMIELARSLGPRIYRALPAYYQCLGMARAEARCFVRSFGATPARVVARVSPVLTRAGQRDQPLALSALPCAAEAGHTLARVIEDTGKWWKAVHPQGVIPGYQLYLAPDDEAMLASIKDTLGAAPAQAYPSVAYPGRGIGWINCARVPDPLARAALASRHVSQSLLSAWSNPAHLYAWLAYGLSAEVSADILDADGIMPRAQTEAQRQAALSAAHAPLPDLASLASQSALEEAWERYGEEALRAYVAEAARLVLAEEGKSRITTWLALSTGEASADEVYEHSFGQALPLATLSQRLRERLAAQAPIHDN